MRRFGYPRRDVLAGEDGRISAWILTPTGLTTPNTVHIWMDDKIWIDEWIWTEEPVVHRFPLTRYGESFVGVEYAWDDTKQWIDGLIWTD